MATDTLYPDADVTQNWTMTGGGHTYSYERVYEGTDTPDDTDYVSTTSASDLVEEWEIGEVAANHNLTSSIQVFFRCGITDDSNVARIQLDLFHSSGTPVTGNPKTVVPVTSSPGAGQVLNDGTLRTVDFTWSTLALNKTEMDSLQLRVTWKPSG